MWSPPAFNTYAVHVINESMKPDRASNSESCLAELAKAVKARVVVRTVEASLVSSWGNQNYCRDFCRMFRRQVQGTLRHGL